MVQSHLGLAGRLRRGHPLAADALNGTTPPPPGESRELLRLGLDGWRRGGGRIGGVDTVLAARAGHAGLAAVAVRGHAGGPGPRQGGGPLHGGGPASVVRRGGHDGGRGRTAWRGARRCGGPGRAPAADVAAAEVQAASQAGRHQVGRSGRRRPGALRPRGGARRGVGVGGVAGRALSPPGAAGAPACRRCRPLPRPRRRRGGARRGGRRAGGRRRDHHGPRPGVRAAAGRGARGRGRGGRRRDLLPHGGVGEHRRGLAATFAGAVVVHVRRRQGWRQGGRRDARLQAVQAGRRRPLGAVQLDATVATVLLGVALRLLELEHVAHQRPVGHHRHLAVVEVEVALRDHGHVARAVLGLHGGLHGVAHRRAEAATGAHAKPGTPRTAPMRGNGPVRTAVRFALPEVPRSRRLFQQDCGS